MNKVIRITMSWRQISIMTGFHWTFCRCMVVEWNVSTQGFLIFDTYKPWIWPTTSWWRFQTAQVAGLVWRSWTCLPISSQWFHLCCSELVWGIHFQCWNWITTTWRSCLLSCVRWKDWYSFILTTTRLQRFHQLLVSCQVQSLCSSMMQNIRYFPWKQQTSWRFALDW